MKVKGQSRFDFLPAHMTSTFPTEAQILEAVDKLREDGVQMLQEIVSHPSLLGQEKSVQDFMESKFLALNDPQLTVKRIPILRTLNFLHIHEVLGLREIY